MIDLLVLAFALTLARVAAFIQFAPLLGGPNTPRLVKVGVSMALASLFFGPSCDAFIAAGGAAQPGTLTWLGLTLALAREAILGGTLGFALNLFLVPARVAGDFIAQESGLTFANVVAATGTGSTNPISALLEMLASFVFLILDLHHLFLLVLQDTLRVYPVGTGFRLPNWDLVTVVSAAEEGGLLLAAPLALCLSLTTVVLMLMTRAAPQLNLYSVGFPLRVLVALGALVLLLPQLMTGITGLLSSSLELLQLR